MFNINLLLKSPPNDKIIEWKSIKRGSIFASYRNKFIEKRLILIYESNM